MEMKMVLTRAMRHTLECVRDGLVKRIYRADGNVLKGPRGTSSTVLWKLDKAGLISDGDNEWGAIERTSIQILTDAGLEALGNR